MQTVGDFLVALIVYGGGPTVFNGFFYRLVERLLLATVTGRFGSKVPKVPLTGRFGA